MESADTVLAELKSRLGRVGIEGSAGESASTSRVIAMTHAPYDVHALEPEDFIEEVTRSAASDCGRCIGAPLMR